MKLRKKHYLYTWQTDDSCLAHQLGAWLSNRLLFSPSQLWDNKSGSKKTCYTARSGATHNNTPFACIVFISKTWKKWCCHTEADKKKPKYIRDCRIISKTSWRSIVFFWSFFSHSKFWFLLHLSPHLSLCVPSNWNNEHQRAYKERIRRELNRTLKAEFDRRTCQELSEAVPATETLNVDAQKERAELARQGSLADRQPPASLVQLRQRLNQAVNGHGLPQPLGENVRQYISPLVMGWLLSSSYPLSWLLFH